MKLCNHDATDMIWSEQEQQPILICNDCEVRLA